MNASQRIQQLQDWIKEDPKDPFLPYAIALEWQNQDQPQQALQQLEAVCEAHPSYLPAFQLRGQILMETSDSQAAKAVLLQALELAKNQQNTKAQQEIQEFINQTEYSDE